MQITSQTYQDILASDDYWFERKLVIAGVAYREDVLVEMTTLSEMFQKTPTIGKAVAAELSVKMLAPSAAIPRMAEVRPYVRATDGTQTSEWLPQGVFFIDTRETTHNDNGLDVLTLHCYDAMLKSEADYPSSTHSWPYSDKNTVKEIAYAMGLQASISASSGIDSRTLTLMNKNYQIELPVGYSMREVLGNIAAMYAGNWIMNYDGKLRLVTLTELPEETNYLVDQTNSPITFGGDRILV